MAAAIVRLRATATMGGRRHFASSSPYLMLPSNKMYCLRDKKVVNINSSSSSNVEKEFESDSVIGSSHGWVGLLKDEKDRVRCGSSSGVSLWNPMSGSRMKLPPIHTYKCDLRELIKLMVNDGDCSRALFLGFSGMLGVCCPGECSEWTLFGSTDSRSREIYVDVVACSQNRVYSVNSDNELVRWNMSDSEPRIRMEWKESLYGLGYNDELVEKENKIIPPEIPGQIFEEYNKAYPHLVYAEHSNQLFVVRRHFVEQMYPNSCDDRMEWSWDYEEELRTNKTVAFDVHLLVENENENSRQLRHMEHSLDGLVMFVGLNSSFAVAAADFPHLKPDSIYFTDYVDWYDGVYEGFDVGIYDYKKGTISSCYYPNYHLLLNRARRFPFWFTPTSAFKG